MLAVPLQSTTLAWALYDPVRKRLQIEFRSGARYIYFQVPALCYQQLLEAPSKGAYFNAHIRNRFLFRHLSPSVLAAPHKTK